MTTAAVVLAAGGGRRFAGPGHKLLAEVGGRPVVAWAVEAALAAHLDEVVVVVGACDVRSAVGPLAAAVRWAPNPRWDQGQATSLATGLAAAARAGHGAVVVGLGDQPLVAASAWRRVAATAAPIAAATYGGRRGHPVLLSRSVWPMLPTEGEVGARAVMASRPDLVVEVPCDGDLPADVDTVEDLDRLLSGPAVAGRPTSGGWPGAPRR